MKIIFLDVDGVLNSERFFAEKAKDGLWVSDNFPYSEIDPLAVTNLNKIIDETGAMVCVSSTWRHGRTRTELQEILDKCGFTGTVIDKTPACDNRIRGHEIKLWSNKARPFERYVILDDDKDMLPEQLPYFVNTHFSTGLDDEATEKAIAILQTI